ncbi:terminase small subunit [Staphylococcus saprophyticus]|uniref:terminase small subunit n=1 Tax=Staphylococcus saprophyticus TaxID=29385 RepID=UPI0022EA6AD7|nr:terminase small subunit [Staphylococcus saprophyticus]
MKLTIKQQRFADAYIKHGNVSKAALDAGYSKAYSRTHAYKLLENASVKTYIDERLEEIKSESIADQTEIMQYLTSVLRGEVTDQELMNVPIGDFESEIQLHEKRADTTARTKAAELLGKRYTMWTEKQEITNRNIDINIGDYDE